MTPASDTRVVIDATNQNPGQAGGEELDEATASTGR